LAAALCHTGGYAYDAVDYEYSAKLSGDSHFGGYRQLQLHICNCNYITTKTSTHPQQSKDEKAFESFNAVTLPCIAAIVRPTTDQLKQQDSFQRTVDSPAGPFVCELWNIRCGSVASSVNNNQVRRLLV
jgi:hypothetical protein